MNGIIVDEKHFARKKVSFSPETKNYDGASKETTDFVKLFQVCIDQMETVTSLDVVGHLEDFGYYGCQAKTFLSYCLEQLEMMNLGLINARNKFISNDPKTLMCPKSIVLISEGKYDNRIQTYICRTGARNVSETVGYGKLERIKEMRELMLEADNFWL